MNEFGLPSCFGAKNRHNVKRNAKELYKLVDFDVQQAFNKHFIFSTDNRHTISSYKLPNPSHLFSHEKWELEHFQELKIHLNNTKSKLNDLNLKDWHQHTTFTNIAGDVLKKLKYSICPEFLTQAWCKMYECLMTFPLVSEEVLQGGVFNSVHLCEAPGAFITALHHFLQTWYSDAKWEWLATTLNPYHESNPLSQMIQDDRFILHTLPHWNFGEDATGNLMDISNLKNLQGQVLTQLDDNVMLVTADGSVDCQTNPAEQEALVAPLHYCETLTALSILQPGGSFMLKMFTLLECDSICLLYLLTSTFGGVSVFKPVKSKEGNSEVYVICTNYFGKDHLAPWWPTLYEQFGPSITKAMFSKDDIPENFFAQVYDCAKHFTKLQTQVIERNLDLFFNPSPEKLLRSKLTKRKITEKYLQHYLLQPVEKVIVGNNILADIQISNFPQKCEEGTFNDRVRQASREESLSADAVEQLWLSAKATVGCSWPFADTVCWFMFNNRTMPKLEVKCGRPVTYVQSSKFCNGRVLAAFNQMTTACFISTSTCEVDTTMLLDTQDYPWSSQSSQCLRQLMTSLLSVLGDLPANKSVRILGVPLLTQLSVALVFLLAHSFYQVGLSKEGNIILVGFKQAINTTQWLQDVVHLMSSLPPSKAVLSLLPINILCDKSYCTMAGVSFYVCVSSINNSTLLDSLEAETRRMKQK